MEEIFLTKTCKNHDTEKFEFYCFTDNSFLCQKCFKHHKKHDIEIISDLKEKSKYIKLLSSKKLSLKEFYLSIKSELETIKKILDVQLQSIDQDLQEDPEDSNNNSKSHSSFTYPDSIFLLSYHEYERLSTLAEVLIKITEMNKILNNLTKYYKSPMNLRTINKEVKIIEKSTDNQNYPIEIMFDKNNSQKYTLFEGSKNNFISVDLGNKYYLQSIQMDFIDAECQLKNFKISIKDDKGEWEEEGKYVCENYGKNKGIQSFDVLKEAQFVRLDFIDTWGNKDGNFMLIKKIMFEIGDIV